MEKLTFSFSLICIAIILLSALPMHGMEKDWVLCPKEDWKKEDWQQWTAEIESSFDTRKLNGNYDSDDDIPELVQLSEDELVKMRKENDLVVARRNNIEELKSDIKSFMKLSSTCKSFNELLTFQRIGSFCEHYLQGSKNTVLRYLIEKRYGVFTVRLPILILISAGADINVSNALETVVCNNDVQLVKTLFRYHANPNVEYYGVCPVFFFADTIEMAQIFIENRVNVHATDSDGLNILWNIVNNGYSFDLMKVYVAHNVDATKLRTEDRSCLLHVLAEGYVVGDIDDFLQKANLLLTIIPHMINELNKENQTPLDVAQKFLQEAQEYKGEEDILALEQLIALFLERGALTAQQLAEQSAIEKLEQ